MKRKEMNKGGGMSKLGKKWGGGERDPSYLLLLSALHWVGIKSPS